MTGISRVRKERVTRGLSQAEVAQIAAVTGSPLSQVRLSQIERGLIPRPNEARALAQIFNVNESELFEKGR